jgi:hypothetical protein
LHRRRHLVTLVFCAVIVSAVSFTSTSEPRDKAFNDTAQVGTRTLWLKRNAWIDLSASKWIAFRNLFWQVNASPKALFRLLAGQPSSETSDGSCTGRRPGGSSIGPKDAR